MHILFVDDCADTCESFIDYFSQLGYSVNAAMSARQALMLAQTFRYDAFVLDIALPDLDGYSLACRIRRLYAFGPRPVIIAVSGFHFDSSHPYAVEAGFDVYLVKPPVLAEIEAALLGMKSVHRNE